MSSGKGEQLPLASQIGESRGEEPLNTVVRTAGTRELPSDFREKHPAIDKTGMSSDLLTNTPSKATHQASALAQEQRTFSPIRNQPQGGATGGGLARLRALGRVGSKLSNDDGDVNLTPTDRQVHTDDPSISFSNQKLKTTETFGVDPQQRRIVGEAPGINAVKDKEVGPTALAGSQPIQSEEFAGLEELRPEIDNIMGQFKHQAINEANSGHSPSGTTLPVFHYPPRTSSLEHHQKVQTSGNSQVADEGGEISPMPAGDPEKFSLSRTSTVSQPPPPEPDPEPDLPFDFHRFLEQLRHRTADPVAKFLRSFLQEFGKKQWMVHEQVKIIGDFLSFIGHRMAQCDVWRHVSEAEFDNAKEGMEKLVMNRLYNQTFSPEIPATEPSKSRLKGANITLAPGRKGQHQEDVERDDVLAQKVRIYGWVREEHLDIKHFGDKGRKFLSLAQKELVKSKTYRAPRDKVICVLNCCKVLFGYLKNIQAQQSADDFIPLLIYTVLKANPDHLVSNVEYILRFRNQEKLNGEAGYYMSSLMGAVQFIENLDRTSLTISEEEFEKNVEQAVSVIAERDENEGKRPTPSSHLPISEKSTPSRPEVTPRHSLEGEQVSPRKSSGRAGPSRGQEPANPYESDDSDAVSGLLRSFQKPFSTIGRIFSDDDEPQIRPGDKTVLTPLPFPASRTFPTHPQQNLPPSQYHSPPPIAHHSNDTPDIRHSLATEDAVARRASAEIAEAHRMQLAEHQTVVETLSGMFPALDKDVISDVVRMKEGKVGLAVDSCLALSR